MERVTRNFKLFFAAFFIIGAVGTILPFAYPHPEEGFNYISVILDTLLILMGVFILTLLFRVIRSSYGSILSRVIFYVFLGVAMLAFSHSFETMLFLFGISAEANEIIHRLFIFITFIPLLYGFRIAAKEMS